MKKKNVLLLVNQLYGGGAQKVIADLSIYLSGYYNITLAIFNDVDKIVFPYDGELVKIQLPFPQNTHTNSFPKRLMRFFALIKQVRKLKKDRKIEVTISFLEASNIINVLTGKSKKIISVRSYLSHEFKDIPRLKVFRNLIHLLYNRADRIVVPSLSVQSDLETNFKVSPRKTKVIYNFTDLERVVASGQEKISAHLESVFRQFPVIINVGRITNPKAQWLLVSVLGEVKKTFPHSKLVILGEGPMQEKILETASKLNLNVYLENKSSKDQIPDYDIYLMGFIKNPYPFLNKSHVYLSSSVYEGFPNVMIEAMTAGIPVISSDCRSGPREILSPSSSFHTNISSKEYAEYGVLLPTSNGDKESEDRYIAEAAGSIVTIFTDGQKRKHYQQQSLKRINNYDRKKIIKQWMELIN